MNINEYLTDPRNRRLILFNPNTIKRFYPSDPFAMAIKNLIYKGVNIDNVVNDTNALIHNINNLNYVYALVECGIDVNFTNNAKRNALFSLSSIFLPNEYKDKIIIPNDRIRVARLLIKKGINTKQIDIEGDNCIGSFTSPLGLDFGTIYYLSQYVTLTKFSLEISIKVFEHLDEKYDRAFSMLHKIFSYYPSKILIESMDKFPILLNYVLTKGRNLIYEKTRHYLYQPHMGLAREASVKYDTTSLCETKSRDTIVKLLITLIDFYNPDIYGQILSHIDDIVINDNPRKTALKYINRFTRHELCEYIQYIHNSCAQK